MTNERRDEPTPGPEHEEELPSALREALDSMNTPDPRPEFRAKLRGAFVAGEVRCSDTAVEAALAQWGVPEPTSEFRSRCRERFLNGAESIGAPLSTASGEGRGRLLRFLPLAAAAVLAAFLLPGMLRAELLWEKLEGGSFTVDGRTVADSSPGEVDRRLEKGSSCRVEDGCERVLFRYDGGLLVEMVKGTQFTISEPRESGTGLAVELVEGSMRVSADEDYRRSVEVTTPDAFILLRGEAVGVDVVPDKGTCVCCVNGDAAVEPSLDSLEPYRLSSGDSTWLEHGSDRVKVMRDEVHHREPLEDLRESARTYFY